MISKIAHWSAVGLTLLILSVEPPVSCNQTFAAPRFQLVNVSTIPGLRQQDLQSLRDLHARFCSQQERLLNEDQSVVREIDQNREQWRRLTNDVFGLHSVLKFPLAIYDDNKVFTSLGIRGDWILNYWKNKFIIEGLLHYYRTIDEVISHFNDELQTLNPGQMPYYQLVTLKEYIWLKTDIWERLHGPRPLAISDFDLDVQQMVMQVRDRFIPQIDRYIWIAETREDVRQKADAAIQKSWERNFAPDSGDFWKWLSDNNTTRDLLNMFHFYDTHKYWGPRGGLPQTTPWRFTMSGYTPEYGYSPRNGVIRNDRGQNTQNTINDPWNDWGMSLYYTTNPGLGQQKKIYEALQLLLPLPPHLRSLLGWIHGSSGYGNDTIRRYQQKLANFTEEQLKDEWALFALGIHPREDPIEKYLILLDIAELKDPASDAWKNKDPRQTISDYLKLVLIDGTDVRIMLLGLRLRFDVRIWNPDTNIDWGSYLFSTDVERAKVKLPNYDSKQGDVTDEDRQRARDQARDDFQAAKQRARQQLDTLLDLRRELYNKLRGLFSNPRSGDWAIRDYFLPRPTAWPPNTVPTLICDEVKTLAIPFAIVNIIRWIDYALISNQLNDYPYTAAFGGGSLFDYRDMLKTLLTDIWTAYGGQIGQEAQTITHVLLLPYLFVAIPSESLINFLQLSPLVGEMARVIGVAAQRDLTSNSGESPLIRKQFLTLVWAADWARIVYKTCLNRPYQAGSFRQQASAWNLDVSKEYINRLQSPPDRQNPAKRHHYAQQSIVPPPPGNNELAANSPFRQRYEVAETVTSPFGNFTLNASNHLVWALHAKTSSTAEITEVERKKLIVQIATEMSRHSSISGLYEALAIEGECTCGTGLLSDAETIGNDYKPLYEKNNDYTLAKIYDNLTTLKNAYQGTGGGGNALRSEDLLYQDTRVVDGRRVFPSCRTRVRFVTEPTSSDLRATHRLRDILNHNAHPENEGGPQARQRYADLMMDPTSEKINGASFMYDDKFYRYLAHYDTRSTEVQLMATLVGLGLSGQTGPLAVLGAIDGYISKLAWDQAKLAMMVLTAGRRMTNEARMDVLTKLLNGGFGTGPDDPMPGGFKKAVGERYLRQWNRRELVSKTRNDLANILARKLPQKEQETEVLTLRASIHDQLVKMPGGWTLIEDPNQQDIAQKFQESIKARVDKGGMDDRQKAKLQEDQFKVAQIFNGPWAKIIREAEIGENLSKQLASCVLNNKAPPLTSEQQQALALDKADGKGPLDAQTPSARRARRQMQIALLKTHSATLGPNRALPSEMPTMMSKRSVRRREEWDAKAKEIDKERRIYSMAKAPVMKRISHVEAELNFTRIYLQNSRDAKDEAYRKGGLANAKGPDKQKFERSWKMKIDGLSDHLDQLENNKAMFVMWAQLLNGPMDQDEVAALPMIESAIARQANESTIDYVTRLINKTKDGSLNSIVGPMAQQRYYRVKQYREARGVRFPTVDQKFYPPATQEERVAQTEFRRRTDAFRRQTEQEWIDKTKHYQALRLVSEVRLKTINQEAKSLAEALDGETLLEFFEVRDAIQEVYIEWVDQCYNYFKTGPSQWRLPATSVIIFHRLSRLEEMIAANDRSIILDYLKEFRRKLDLIEMAAEAFAPPPGVARASPLWTNNGLFVRHPAHYPLYEEVKRQATEGLVPTDPNPGQSIRNFQTLMLAHSQWYVTNELGTLDRKLGESMDVLAPKKFAWNMTSLDDSKVEYHRSFEIRALTKMRDLAAYGRYRILLTNPRDELLNRFYGAAVRAAFVFKDPCVNPGNDVRGDEPLQRSLARINQEIHYDETFVDFDKPGERLVISVNEHSAAVINPFFVRRMEDYENVSQFRPPGNVLPLRFYDRKKFEDLGKKYIRLVATALREAPQNNADLLNSVNAWHFPWVAVSEETRSLLFDRLNVVRVIWRSLSHLEALSEINLPADLDNPQAGERSAQLIFIEFYIKTQFGFLIDLQQTLQKCNDDAQFRIRMTWIAIGLELASFGLATIPAKLAQAGFAASRVMYGLRVLAHIYQKVVLPAREAMHLIVAGKAIMEMYNLARTGRVVHTSWTDAYEHWWGMTLVLISMHYMSGAMQTEAIMGSIQSSLGPGWVQAYGILTGMTSMFVATFFWDVVYHHERVDKSAWNGMVGMFYGANMHKALGWKMGAQSRPWLSAMLTYIVNAGYGAGMSLLHFWVHPEDFGATEEERAKLSKWTIFFNSLFSTLAMDLMAAKHEYQHVTRAVNKKFVQSHLERNPDFNISEARVFGDDILVEVLREAPFSKINEMTNKPFDRNNDVMGFLAEQSGFSLGPNGANRDAAVNGYRSMLNANYQGAVNEFQTAYGQAFRNQFGVDLPAPPIESLSLAFLEGAPMRLKPSDYLMLNLQTALNPAFAP